MAHLTYVRPGGIWAAFAVPTHGEMTQFDQNLVKCINGDEGGTWAPSSVITIGGLGLSITGAFTSTNLTITGDSVFEGSAVFGGPGESFTVLAQTVVFAASGGSVSVGSGTTWTFNDVPIFANGFTVSGGTANIATGLVVSGSATLESNAVVQGNLTVDGTTTVFSPVVLSAGAHVRQRVVAGAAANGTYSVSTADRVRGAALGSGTFTYRIDNVGAGQGSEIEFQVSGGTINFLRDIDSSSLGSITSSGTIKWIRFIFDGGAWQFWASN